MELHSDRTLTTQGVKTVESIIQSLSTTHSYTIVHNFCKRIEQLKSPLYLVLKEANRKFWTLRRRKTCKFLYCSIKVEQINYTTLSILVITNIFVSAIESFSVLLLDSWSGHSCKPARIYTKKKDKDIRMLTI